MAKSYADKNGKNPPTGSTRSDAMKRFAAAKQNEQPDWGRIEPQLVWQFIQRMTQDDGAVMFGYSRDGGAYSIKVYAGDEPEKAYFHSDQEITDFMQYMLEA